MRTILRAAAALASAHAPAALAHAGHSAPLVHLHPGELAGAVLACLIAGAAACWTLARRERRARR